MARHQYGIFAEGTRAHRHLEWTLADDAGVDALRAAVSATRLADADHRATGGVNLVIGFGPTAWERIGPAGATSPAAPFPGYASPDGAHRAPATQRDVWVWLHGPTPDLLIDVVRAIVAAWAPVAELALDVDGFTYKDSRDLTGFIDGTANPMLDEAPVVATIPDGSPGGGGCCAMTMRFVHDLDAFHARSESDQERVFGRTKRDSIEMDDDTKPEDAHIARAEVEDDHGEELEVYRRSVPWANATTQGLHFVSFGADTDRFDLQLRRIFGVVDGPVDHLLSFTTATTGSFWLCPTVEDLDAVAPVPDEDD